VLAQFLVEAGAEGYFPVLAALALANVDPHHRFVNVGDLQVHDLGTTCSRTVRRHEQGAVVGSVGRFDQARHFFHAQDQRQVGWSLGVGRVFHAPTLTKGLDIKEA
jgi:hypothetical protein